MSIRSSLVRLVAFAVLAFATLTLDAGMAAAQEPVPPPPPDTTQNTALRAFLDCEVFGCDHDFLKTEMTWVNWMRERQDADFHLLVTSITTGAGGRRFTVVAIGQRSFAGRTDTLEFVTSPDDTEDQVRRPMLRTFGQLLLPYAARTPLGSRLTISFAPAAEGAPKASAATDRWNFWVYSISSNAYLSGESHQSFIDVYSDVSANRTTEQWKIRMSLNGSYGRQKFTYEDDTGTGPVWITTIGKSRSANLSAMAVKSVNEHWSVGGRGIVSNSKFNNLDLATQVSAAVEWDYFPYKDFTRRAFTVLYTVGVRALDYNTETIYGKTTEVRPVHTLHATISARQPWGSANVTFSGSQYLDGLKYYGAGIGGNVDVRVARGLSFEIGGNLSRVRNQLYLSGAGLSPADVLLRQQALQTNFRYFTFIGMRYQFGSMFNSVVNPRFDRIGGIDDF